jgi:hypothetical protein
MYRHQHSHSRRLAFVRVDLGPQHPDTLTTMYSLGLVYTSQNRDAEAEKLLAHVLACEEKAYGLSHPHMQKTVEELLSAYEKLGRVDEARMLKQRISPWTT